MKKYFAILCLLFSISKISAQTYNNEWIDYSKTYYKFSVGAEGLYRLTDSTLATIGLSNVQAQYFQLWHNGVQVPVYTTVSTGLFSSTDYIEFYGFMNDGSTDTKLYKIDSLQMNSKWSLYTDTAAYFLTVDTVNTNLRMTTGTNNVAGNSLSVEPYFMYNLKYFYKQQMNPGFGYDLGELVSAASYETAEGWASNNIISGSSITSNNALIHLYAAGPPASLQAVVAGNDYTTRTCNININGTTVASTTIAGYNIKVASAINIPLSTFTSNAANITFLNTASPVSDNMIVASYNITYPRTFDFGGQSKFNFTLAPTAKGYYLQIADFNYNSSVPVLYDLTNNIRYTAVVNAGLVEFVLPTSVTPTNFVLCSTNGSAVLKCQNLIQRNFTDYSQPSNQGDYLIVSNPVLYNDGLGNNYVENYRQYRSSSVGGNYNAKTIDITQLIDQFAFGVKHHPASIRNFSYYASSHFSSVPKYFFLIGKGLNYVAFRSNESDPNINKQALVPTFGTPASDMLLLATRTGEYPLIPIGRLSALTGNDINIYLQKVMQFELAQQSTSQTIAAKAWMKNIGEVAGGESDSNLTNLINSYLQGYSTICKDTLFGAKVYNFDSNTGSKYATGSNMTMDSLINNGVNLITYFGHSSPNTIEFNLDNPDFYNNTGKYPVMMVNGCMAGDIFEFDTLRYISGGTLSDKFIFTPQRGSVGYIACSSFGLPAQLNSYNSEFYNNFSLKMYGQSLGKILKTTVTNDYLNNSGDYIAQATLETMTLHGDPALVMNTQSKPDYAIEDSVLTFCPSVLTVGNNQVTIKARIFNLGTAVNDSVQIKVLLTTPDSVVSVIYNSKLKPIMFEDSVVVTVPLNPLINKGTNQITVTIDPDNLVNEITKTNNSVTKSMVINSNGISPVFPYNYSIVNNSNPDLYASTDDPLADSTKYVMQFDTTALFNSPNLIVQNVIAKGGVIKFSPNAVLMDSTVYYWRVAIGPITMNTYWKNSSFIYINGTDSGFSQSHFFQFQNDVDTSIYIDSTARMFYFQNTTDNLVTRNGVYPYYSYDQNNVYLNANLIDFWGCQFSVIQFYVFDSATLKPWVNPNNGASKGLYNSDAVCGGTPRNFFEYPINTLAGRQNAMNFFDSIPSGCVVLIRNLLWTSGGTNFLVNSWMADTAVLGSGVSLWNTFHKYGLTKIDSFTSLLPFVFIFKKGFPNFPIEQEMASSTNAQLVNSIWVPASQTQGTFTSTWLGPVKAWKNFKWDANNPLTTTTKRFDIIGKDINGNQTLLASVYNSKDTSISFIDAKKYPYLQLRMYSQDTVSVSPTQLKYWMLTGSPAPEGAVSPNITYNFQPTLTTNDSLQFKVAFKNVSNTAFDSIKLRLTINAKNGMTYIYNNLQSGQKLAPLPNNDTVVISYSIPVQNLYGKNQLFLEVNPDSDQVEQFHFNNVLYQNFNVIFPPVCPGGVATIYAVNLDSGNIYQWQVDSGNGYTNLANQGIYSGVNGDTLTISQAATNLYTNKYRCFITNNSVTSFSDTISLKFQMKWTGQVDSVWENPANWSCNQLPDIYTDVIIDSGYSNYPVIQSNANCRSITLNPGSSVAIKPTYNLNIANTP